MKNHLLIILFTMLFGTVLAQNVPQGMNYQGVARDKAGQVLADQQIFLKISLISGTGKSPSVYYAETQEVVTNKFGLFTLVIGAGSQIDGDWNSIPWSSKEVWLNVDIKMNLNEDYVSLNTTQMLAVPYAYHSGTAESISINNSNNTNSSGPTIQSGTPSGNSWNTPGNLVTNPLTDYVGTADSTDLIFKTNHTERLRIYSSGNINMNNSLTIGLDLTVGRDATVNRNLLVKQSAVIDSNLTVFKNVNLNTIGGATTNYGPFTVGNVSPSILTGSLRVDQITNLQNGLNVNNATPTLLTGTLRVNNATDLYSSFTVNSKANSAMTGILRVDSNVTFKQHLTLDNSTLQSTSTSTGAAVVAGGVGIGRNLNVGEDANFGGHTSFAGPVSITDATPSTNTTTGALIVTGGTGIGNQLNVGGATLLSSTLGVTGATTLSNTLGVTGATTLSSTLGVTGATTLSSTLGVTGITTLSDKLNANGPVTITANPGSGTQSNYTDYPLQVQGSNQGIAVKVSSAKSISNNYVSFWDNSNTMQGRIEGLAAGEATGTADYQSRLASLNSGIAYASTSQAIADVNVVMAAANTIAAAASTTPCVGLGACETAPIISLIFGTIANDVVAAASYVETALQLSDAVDAKNNFVSTEAAANGVTYESGAGDYAEYLAKADANEKFAAGDIIGVRGGKISKNTEGAEKMMVISKKPIVLGNMQQGDESQFEKVAFLGQVPVYVFGKVNVGDYILPNGLSNGIGVAVSPKDIKSKDIKNIVGIAWSGSSKSMDIHPINVAVGLNINDNQKVVDELQGQVNDLKNQVAQTNALLEKLVPGFKSTTPAEASKAQQGNQANVAPQPGAVKYHYITREDILKGITLAENAMRDRGVNIEGHPFWKKLNSDQAFKENLISQLQEKYKKGIEEHKLIDENK